MSEPTSHTTDKPAHFDLSKPLEEQEPTPELLRDLLKAYADGLEAVKNVTVQSAANSVYLVHTGQYAGRR